MVNIKRSLFFRFKQMTADANGYFHLCESAIISVHQFLRSKKEVLDDFRYSSRSSAF
jgi:hypothetical protein